MVGGRVAGGRGCSGDGWGEGGGEARGNARTGGGGGGEEGRSWWGAGYLKKKRSVSVAARGAGVAMSPVFNAAGQVTVGELGLAPVGSTLEVIRAVHARGSLVSMKRLVNELS